MDRNRLKGIFQSITQAGEEGRRNRSTLLSVTHLATVRDADGRPTSVEGVVVSSNANRGSLRVTVAPWRDDGWRWTCTCDDARIRGRSHGPCKHTLAVCDLGLLKILQRERAEALAADTARLESVNPPSQEPVNVSDLTPPPGTWAFIAGLLAGPNPSEQEGAYWDNWKDEMKVRRPEG